MAVRVLLVLAALSVLLAACGETAQESEPKPETTQESKPTPTPAPTTPAPLKYGDPVEIIGIPWSEPEVIDYEGRRVVVVVFQYEEGPDRFVGVTSAYGGQAAKELRAAGAAARQPEPPEYRLEGKYEGRVTISDGGKNKYEALWVESAEPL
jgi:hypothetical protein